MAELTLKPQEIESVPNGIFLKVDGICDVTSEDMLKDELEKLVKSGYARFIIDLSGLKFLNSNGFAQLVALADKLRQIGGKLVLNTVPKEIAEMSQFLGLSDFFSFSENYNHGVAILLGVKPASSSRTVSAIKTKTTKSARLSSIGPPPAPSPYEASLKKSSKNYSNTKKEDSTEYKNISRIAVLNIPRKLSLNKHYPVKIVIGKKNDPAISNAQNTDTIISRTELNISADNPYVTVLPEVSGCQINPRHTCLDVSLGTMEYTFWMQPIDSELIGDATIQLFYGREIIDELQTTLTLEHL